MPLASNQTLESPPNTPTAKKKRVYLGAGAHVPRQTSRKTLGLAIAIVLLAATALPLLAVLHAIPRARRQTATRSDDTEVEMYAEPEGEAEPVSTVDELADSQSTDSNNEDTDTEPDDGDDDDNELESPPSDADASPELLSLREALRNSARRGPRNTSFVLVTATSYPYRYFALNLACSLRSVGDGRLLVIALDSRTLTWARMHKFAAALLPPSGFYAPIEAEPTPGADTRRTAIFGSRRFNTLSHRKVLAVRTILAEGYDALFADADMYWCSGGQLAHEIAMRTYASGAHMSFQRTVVGTQHANTGLYYARTSRDTIAFLDAVLLAGTARRDDQKVVNALLCDPSNGGDKVEVMRRRGKPYPRYCVWRHRMRAAFLPERRFPIGCTMFRGKPLRKHSGLWLRTSCAKRSFTLLHFSCFSVRDKKRAMRKAGMWVVNERADACIAN